MNPEPFKIFRFLSLLCLAFLALTPQVMAQTPVGLKIGLNAGQVQLTATGAVSTVCQIQWTDSFPATNRWFQLGFSVIANSPSPLTDSSPLSGGHRYYRAVWTPNTNLVWIPPGTFTMGSPTGGEALRGTDETQHVVTLSQGLWMGKYLVTQGDYQAVVGSNPSYFSPNNGYSLDLTRPVEEVEWPDATNYCALRTQQEQMAGLIPADYSYRLPTESEWEYADRAGTTTAFYLGSALPSGQANFDGTHEYDATLGQISNPSGINLQNTTPVGSYGANPWGLYDMIGNVGEWCQDWYNTYPTGPVTDPIGDVETGSRVTRGGFWHGAGQYCRSAHRFFNNPTDKFQFLGFRVVLAPNPS